MRIDFEFQDMYFSERGGPGGTFILLFFTRGEVSRIGVVTKKNKKQAFFESHGRHLLCA